MFRKKNTKERTKHDDKLLEYVLAGDAINLRQIVEKKKYSSLLSADEKGRVPIFEAVRLGFTKVAEILIAADAECVTATDEDGRTALHVAALHGQHECVTLLLKKGAPANASDVKEQTALHHAAIAGNVDAIQALLAFQSDTEAKDKDGNTVLLCAAKANQREAVYTLLNASANVNASNKQQKTSLMYACEHGASEVVRTLVQRGARVDPKDTGGRTALSYAKLGAHEACVAALPEDAPLGKMQAAPASPKASHTNTFTHTDLASSSSSAASASASAHGATTGNGSVGGVENGAEAGGDTLGSLTHTTSSDSLPAPRRVSITGGYTELKDRVESLTLSLEKEKSAHAQAKAEIAQLKAQLAAFQPDEEEVTFSDEDLDLSESAPREGSPSRRDSNDPSALRKRVGALTLENQEMKTRIDSLTQTLAQTEEREKEAREKAAEAEVLRKKVEDLEDRLSSIPSTSTVPMVPAMVVEQLREDFKRQLEDARKEKEGSGSADGDVVNVYRKQLLLAVTGQLEESVKQQLLQIAALSLNETSS